MTEIRPFSFDGHDVRTITDDQGETHFVLADVLRALGIERRPSAVADRLDDDVRQTYPITDALGRPQIALAVTEAGLYDVILRSDKPQAKPFRRWVTHEVIPALRRTGSYSMAAQVPQTYAEALRAAAREVEAREAMEAYARELEPKAGAYDTFLSGDGTYSVGNVAKMYGLSQPKLFNLLRSAGVLIAKGHMRNTPYQKYMHHFTVRGGTFTRSDGTEGNSYTTRVQPSGVEFVGRKLGLNRVLDVDVDQGMEAAA